LPEQAKACQAKIFAGLFAGRGNWVLFRSKAKPV